MNFSNFFNEYGYQPSKGWVGYKKQLEEQKMKTEFHDKFDKGFVPGSPVPEPPKPKPKAKCLTFTAVEDNSSVGFHYWIGPSSGTIPDLDKNIQYSTDGGETWQEYAITNSYQTAQKIVLQHEGDSVMFKGNNETLYSSDPYGLVKCTLEGKVAASGDITSLLNGVGGDIPIPERCFSMFFFYENELVTAPNLPSTVLSNYAYGAMFTNCTSLTEAPELPAKTLASACYQSMFFDCTSLTKAPELPAKTLVNNCYNVMFSGCTSLTEITCLATDISEENCTYDWLYGVSQTGTFTKAAGMNAWTTGNNGIPSGWTVENK